MALKEGRFAAVVLEQGPIDRGVVRITRDDSWTSLSSFEQAASPLVSGKGPKMKKRKEKRSEVRRRRIRYRTWVSDQLLLMMPLRRDSLLVAWCVSTAPCIWQSLVLFAFLPEEYSSGSTVEDMFLTSLLCSIPATSCVCHPGVALYVFDLADPVSSGMYSGTLVCSQLQLRSSFW